MRLILNVKGHTLDLSFGPDAEPAEPLEPQPRGDVFAVLERKEQWDHDHRMPIGFAP